MDRVSRVTVVTGGSRGIGAATAQRLASEGHAVVVGYRADAAGAGEVAARVAAAGGRCRAVRADTTSEAEVERLFSVAAEFGPVTGLVNNAAVTGQRGRLAETPIADIRRVVEVNLIGSIVCCRAAWAHMAVSSGGSGGAIVNVSSVAAATGSANTYVHYAASKAGVETVTVGLAKEWGGDGIRVNAVAPGTIHTAIHDFDRNPGSLRTKAAQIPLGRVGQPSEVAEAIAWLLSPAASFTSGAVLRVSGGF